MSQNVKSNSIVENYNTGTTAGVTFTKTGVIRVARQAKKRPKRKTKG